MWEHQGDTRITGYVTQLGQSSFYLKRKNWKNVNNQQKINSYHNEMIFFIANG
jgi:hypothetical protein